jgi:hypothetical protein
MVKNKALQQKDSRLALGLTLLVIGLLFLLDKIGFFSVFSSSVRDVVMDWRNFFFYAGVIFFFAKKDKTPGIILIILGIVFYFKSIFGYLKGLDDLIGPVILIVLGIVFVYLALRR